jgi:hypothetical protein
MSKLLYPAGTRVLYNVSPAIDRGGGKVGFILRDLFEDDGGCCIEFDEYVGGHEGAGFGKNGHCWNVDISRCIFNPPRCRLKLNRLKAKCGTRV